MASLTLITFIDRAYRLRSGTVGALYERPLPFRCAKLLLSEEAWPRRHT
jgi:hypothetical protein